MESNSVEDTVSSEGPVEGFRGVVSNFVKSVSSAGLTRQRQLYQVLNKAIANTDELPDFVIEGLIRRTVSFVFNRYQDKDSRQLVESTVRALRTRNARATLKCLCEAAIGHCVISPTFLTKNSNINAAIIAKWILECLAVLQDTSDKRLLESVVTALGASAYYAEFNHRGTRIMRKALQEYSKKKQSKLLVDSLKDIAEPQKEVKALCLAAFLAQCESLTDDEKSTLTTFWLDTYGKCALLSQKTPSEHVTNVDRIFEFFTTQNVEQVFIPTAKKALLRSPEIAVHGVRHFLEHLRVNLDETAVDFFKTTANCTTNSDESVRLAAVQSSALVAKKVSKASVFSGLLDSAFAQLESNKKAGVGQRLAAAMLISEMSSHQFKDKEADDLTSSVLKRLTPVIVNEAQEDTAKTLWNAVEQWSVHASQFPNTGLEIYRKACASDVRPAIRSAALRVVAAVYNRFPEEKVDSALLDAVKKLFKTLDSGHAQQPEVIPVLYLLLRGSNGNPDQSLRDCLQSLAVKEKLVTSLDEKTALLIPVLAETSLPLFDDKLPQGVVQLMSASLFWPSHEVRTRALEASKKLAPVIGLNFRLALVETILGDIQSGFLPQAVRKLYETRNPNPEKDRESSEHSGVPGWNICFVASNLLHLESEKDDESLYPKFLVASLLLCSLENAAKHDGRVWVNWVTKSEHLKAVFKSREFCDHAVDQLFSDKSAQSRGNAIQLLVSLGELGHDVSDAIWKRSTEQVRSIDIVKYLAIPQSSVDIFKTPEGTLYNTRVIEENSDDAIASKNVKRESKAYKFKEQMAEIELRKELAEKNRREGKLTQRQQKAVDAELVSESKVRKEMAGLHEEVAKKLDILSVAARYNPNGASNHIDLLFDVVVPMLKSPLVSKLAAQAFFAFRDAFFEPTGDRLHELVAHASLRVLNSSWLDSSWSQEPLEEQLKRTFTSLASMCLVIPEMEMDPAAASEMMDEEDLDFIEGITASKLGLLVPMIGELLRSQSYDTKLKDRITHFLKNAINPQFIKGNELTSLPVIRLMAVLLQTMASPTAIEFVDNVLDALQNYCKMLRDTEQLDASVSLFTNELLKYLQHEDPSVRRNVYMLLLLMVNRMREAFALDAELKFTLTRALYLASHDQDEECRKNAALLWSELRLKTSKSLCFALIEDLRSPSAFIRHSAAWSLKEILIDFETEFEAVVSSLAAIYKELNKVQPAVFDDVGRKVRDESDPWEARSGIAEGLLQLSDDVPSNLTMAVVKIVVPEGISDRNELCRDLMRQAGCNVLKNHGEESMGTLLPYLEDILDNTPDGAAYDNLRQGLVVMMGTLARHLDPSHEKLRQIFARLIEALSTNSEKVQQSVADCLPALVPVLRDEARALIPKLVMLLSSTEDYGERRGAAFGIAGLVSGLGMGVMKELELAKTIQKMISNKQNAKHRQGALFCIEMLCTIVGKIFEPYIVQLLPDLLNCFGDSSVDVRAAAEKTANAMMRSLSPYGVKLVLPTLLKSLDNDSWRTKEACAELLGAMSNCAPRQLSTCLPSVVPKLCEVMADSQIKVSKAGERALKQIANVIQNPEVMAIKSYLEAALKDPAGKTVSCLQTIVNTRFVHHVDSPSLALMMPIIKRALTERTEARKTASHIIANIYKLVDHRDMEPYLDELMPGLKKALLDPVPEVRTVAAKAIGSTVKYSSKEKSEKLQEDLMPWLRKNLVSPNSVVDRSGAAQGLSEVIAAIGEDFLRASMPEVVKITESVHTEPYIRDGYILLYIYLPLVLEDKFIPFIPMIVPSILKALADENEYVRDSALRAGQRLIAMYCNQAKKLLLPQLQIAIIHESWRIRQAAVKLIGDFLFTISGISGKMTSDTTHEDDTLGMENVDKTLMRQLGQKSRDEIIAGLYLTRHDTSLLVRQASSHVWKVVVANTPKTLKEVIKTLFDLIIHCLSSASEDRRQMAARCLGELVKKMGERVLTEILPVLKKGLESESVQERHGVALALNEIITNTHRDIILTHTNDLMEPIKKCICDKAKPVQVAAAEMFNSFYQSVGYVAMEEVVGPLLEEFNTTSDDNILDGLCEVMSHNSRQLLPALLPKLTKPPINSIALCRLAAAAGDHLSRHVPKVLESLLGETSITDPQEHIANCIPVLMSVTDEEGVGIMVNTLLKRATQEQHVTSAILLKELTTNSRADLIEVFEPLCNGLLQLYNSAEPELVENAIDAVGALVKRADAAAIVCVIPTFRKAANSLRANAINGHVPGLCNPRGWQPLLAILREGMLSGTVDAKETAALAFGYLLSVSSEDGVRPHAIGMAGPLIRVLGDRYPPAVKQAVLNTMLRLLDKATASLKPFVPQMQSIFFKTLQEPGPAAMRLSAGGALSRLVAIHPKPDAIATDIVKAATASDDAVIIESLLVTLRAVVANATGKIKAETLATLEPLSKTPKHPENSSVNAASGALYGQLVLSGVSVSAPNFFKELGDSSDVHKQFRQCSALQYLLKSSVDKTVEVLRKDELLPALTTAMQIEHSPAACSAVRSTAYLLLSDGQNMNVALLTALARTMNHPSSDVKKQVAVALTHIAAEVDLSQAQLKIVVPMLINGTKEKNSAVRATSEAALVQSFQLRQATAKYDQYVDSLEGAARDVLVELYTKILQKVAKQPDTGVDQLDNFVAVP